MTTYTKTALVERLQKRDLKITFTKANGKNRVMKCTLNPEVIPKTSGKLGGEARGVMTVWGIVEKAWRSITVNSIIEVENI